MEPKKGMIIRDINGRNLTLRAPDYVWILSPPENGHVLVEKKDKQEKIPEHAVVDTPVPSPDINELRKKDDCFGRSAEHFNEVYKSDMNMFRLLRCKRHGKLFLDDTRGGWVMYGLLILVDDDDAKDSPDTIWNRYHSMPDDWLRYLGIAR